jgi:hypothetical protein
MPRPGRRVGNRSNPLIFFFGELHRLSAEVVLLTEAVSSQSGRVVNCVEGVVWLCVRMPVLDGPLLVIVFGRLAPDLGKELTAFLQPRKVDALLLDASKDHAD